MKIKDLLLAILVAVIWGLAFVVTKFGLAEFSAAELAALRFAVAAIPCLFVQRPAISWTLLIAISATLFIGQFLAQFYGIAHGVPPGLSSVIVQSQALFTVVFAALIFRERPTPAQVTGIVVATAGLAIICLTVGYEFSVAAFAVLMISPLSFAVGNLLLRKAGHVRLFNLFAWLSLVPPLPLLALAVATEGPQAVAATLGHMSLIGVAVVLFLGVVATTLAYGIWGYLLRTYSAAEVAPFALLVPVVGAIGSAVVFGEQFGSLRLMGMGTVLCGIALMVLFGRRPTLLQAA